MSLETLPDVSLGLEMHEMPPSPITLGGVGLAGVEGPGSIDQVLSLEDLDALRGTLANPEARAAFQSR